VGASSAEITNYVTYNYVDNIWTIGTFARGAWIHAGTKDYPIAASNDLTNVNTNYIYNQEFGHDAEAVELVGYAESGSVELGDGEDIMFLSRFIADFGFTGMTSNANLTVTIKGKMFPLETLKTLYTSTVLENTAQNHIRVRSREVSLRIESAGTGYSWKMGDFRFDSKKDGRR